MVYIVKRDGRREPYDEHKVINAVKKALLDVGSDYDESLPARIASNITDWIQKSTEEKTVEEIQDKVENKLMASNRKDAAKAFILYRADRTKIRNRNSQFMKTIASKIKASDVQNQNANVDEHSFGGRKGQAASELMRQYALDNCVSRMSRQNHLNNEIYIHDLDSYALGEHNCLSIPFDDLLAKGFNTRQTDVRPANSINTAFQLVAVIFQLQSLQQFGGCSATHLDWTMVPYVRKSFAKHFGDGVHYCEFETRDLDDFIDISESWKDMSIEDKRFKEFDKAYRYAMKMTERELKQSVEGMYHNLSNWVA